MNARQTKRFSLKKLESYLQDIDEFEQPKVELEQYATPPYIAALVLNTIDSSFGDLEGKIVADLGCGTGRLTVGSILCDAQMVYGFDIDGEALKCGLANISETLGSDTDDDDDKLAAAYRGCSKFNLIQADVVGAENDKFWDLMSKRFDTVIMNPPFGTKNNQGLDMIFLKRAIDLSMGSVYSLHKTSTREFILGKAKGWGVEAKPIAQIRYNLDSTYKFHKKKSVDIDVDLWRIDCSGESEPVVDAPQ